MAGAKITYQVVKKQALQSLTGLDLRVKDPTPVLQDFCGYMRLSTDKNFDAQGRPARWAPLKLGTMSGWISSRSSWWNKTRKDGGRSLSVAGRSSLAGRLILTDTSRLRNSIKFRVLAGGRGVEGFTNVKYAAIQQLGGRIPPIKPTNKKALFWAGLAHPVKGTKGGIIPPRPFLIFQDEDIYGYLYPRLKSYVEGG